MSNPVPEVMTPETMLAWLESVDAWRRGERLERAVTAWCAALPGTNSRLRQLVRAAELTRRVRPPADAKNPRLAVRQARLEIIARMSGPTADRP